MTYVIFKPPIIPNSSSTVIEYWCHNFSIQHFCWNFFCFRFFGLVNVNLSWNKSEIKNVINSIKKSKRKFIQWAVACFRHYCLIDVITDLYFFFFYQIFYKEVNNIDNKRSTTGQTDKSDNSPTTNRKQLWAYRKINIIPFSTNSLLITNIILL